MNIVSLNRAVVQFLSILGYSEDDQVYTRCLPGSRANQTHQNLESIDIDALVQANESGRDVFFVVNGQSQKKDQVKLGRALFVEWDDISESEQRQRLANAGLPAPSVVVSTGNKSLHYYWAFDEPIDIESWAKLQTDANAALGSDPSIKDKSRIMRLPGFKHRKTGERAAIVEAGGAQYRFDELRAIVPYVEPEPTSGRSERRGSGIDGNGIDEAIEALSAAERLGSDELSDEVLDDIEALKEVPAGKRNAELYRVSSEVGFWVAVLKADPTKAYQLLINASAVWGGDRAKDFDTIERGFDGGCQKALQTIERCGGDVPAAAAMYEQLEPSERIDCLLMDKDERVTAQILESIEGHRVTMIKAPKGSGKTQVVKRATRRGKVLSICHRRSLVGQQCEEFELTNYKDLQGKEQRLGVCIDSLLKIKVAEWRGAVVILDEVRQLLEHLLFSETHVKDIRGAVVKRFQALCRGASKVIAMDADLTWLEAEFFQRMLGIEPYVIENAAVKPKRLPALQFGSKGACLKQLEASLKEGRRCYVSTDSKAQAVALGEFVGGIVGEGQTLVIHGDNSQLADRVRFISKPNDECWKYQAVIASPSVGTGVSISGRGAFDDVFLFAVNMNALNAHDLAQGMARVRQPKRVFVFAQQRRQWLGAKESGVYITKAEQYAHRLLEDYRAALGCEAKTDQNIECFYWLINHQTARRHCLQYMAYGMLIEKLRESEGLKLRFHKADDIETDREIARAVGRLSQLAQERRIREVLSADDIDHAKATAIRASQAAGIAVDKPDTVALMRYRVQSLLGRSEIDESDVREYLGGLADQVELFAVVFGFGAEFAQCLDEMQIKGDVFPSDVFPYSKVREAMRAALVSWVIDEDGKPLEFDEAALSARGNFARKVAEVAGMLYVEGSQQSPLSRPAGEYKTKVALVKALLKALGLKVKSKRVGRGKARKRVHCLDMARFGEMQRLAEHNHSKRAANVAVGLASSDDPTVYEWAERLLDTVQTSDEQRRRFEFVSNLENAMF